MDILQRSINDSNIKTVIFTNSIKIGQSVYASLVLLSYANSHVHPLAIA